MKKLLAGILITSMAATPVQASDLEVRIHNINEIAGTLYWAVYDSAEDYDAQSSPVFSARSRVMAENMIVTLHGLPAGRYAVRLFHDANENGELDSNMLGIPTEGYGFSNGAGTFGPASYEDAAVSIDADTRVDIRLR